MIKKPMKAATLELEDINKIKYPVLGTDKEDGIRCIKVNGKALSNSLKPIRNIFIRNHIEKYCPDGFDGELVIEGKEWNERSSGIMSEDGKPDFTYIVFDYVKDSQFAPYVQRMKDLAACPQISRIKYLLPTRINNETEFLAFEKKCLTKKKEGVMFRSPMGPYKFGKSTFNEGYLIKFKRFTDGEAIVISLYEKMHNTNIATTDALGHSKRSSHLIGQVPAGTLGGFWVRDIESG